MSKAKVFSIDNTPNSECNEKQLGIKKKYLTKRSQIIEAYKDSLATFNEYIDRQKTNLNVIEWVLLLFLTASALSIIIAIMNGAVVNGWMYFFVFCITVCKAIAIDVMIWYHAKEISISKKYSVSTYGSYIILGILICISIYANYKFQDIVSPDNVWESIIYGAIIPVIILSSTINKIKLEVGVELMKKEGYERLDSDKDKSLKDLKSEMETSFRYASRIEKSKLQRDLQKRRRSDMGKYFEGGNRE